MDRRIAPATVCRNNPTATRNTDVLTWVFGCPVVLASLASHVVVPGWMDFILMNRM